jgi:formylmethanofuran dehydrogenase subunit E
VEWPEDPLTSALVLCDGCGELVVETHLISNNGKQLCRPCSEKGRDSD